jgi:polysaccharide biosynthesis/export protein
MRTQMMNFPVTRFLPVVAVLLFSAPVYSQDAQPGLKENPMVALQAFEPAPNAEYQLGPGDEITVEVVGRPELSGKHTIGPDGFITLPVAGDVKIDDQTRTEAAKTLQSQLGKYYSNASVSVGVDKYTSNSVQLVGAVEHPGVISFDGTPTLLEVISRGGRQMEGPQGSAGVQKPGPAVIPERVAIWRANKDHANTEVMWIQYRELVESGSPLANMRLKRNDTVFVPSAKDVYISILGDVPHPGTMQLESTSTLRQLIAEAGGPLHSAGRNPKIQVIQQASGATPGKTREIEYADVLSPKPLDITLHSGDIIFVPQSGFDHFGYVLQQLSPLITLGTFTALAAR